MSENYGKPLSMVMFMMTCIFGLLYFLLSSLIAFPVFSIKMAVLDATTIDKLKFFWELFTAIAPIVFALAAYILNFCGRGEIGGLLGLVMLLLNIFKGVDFSNVQMLLRFLTDVSFSFLIIAYSISDGDYRHHVAWLLIAIGLCVLRACDMIAATVVPGADIVFEVLIGIACILTHLFAFLSFIPKAGNQLANLSTVGTRKAGEVASQPQASKESSYSPKQPAHAASRNSIDAYKRQKM